MPGLRQVCAYCTLAIRTRPRTGAVCVENVKRLLYFLSLRTLRSRGQVSSTTTRRQAPGTERSDGVRKAWQTCCSVSVSRGGIFDFLAFPFFPMPAIADNGPVVEVRGIDPD